MTMNPAYKKFVAMLHVFLLMSSAPIEAARVIVEENSQWGADCQSLRARFESNVDRAASSLPAAQDSGGHAGFVSTSSVLLHFTRASRALNRAASDECEWMTDGSVDSQRLVEMARRTLATNPCLPVARSIVGAAANDTASQGQAFGEAVQVLLSPTCELPGESEGEVEGPEDVQEDVDEEVDELTDELLADEEGAEARMMSLLEQGTVNVSVGSVAEGAAVGGIQFVAEHIWPPPSISGRVSLRTGDGSEEVVEGSGPHGVGQWLLHVVGLMAWFLAAISFCGAVTTAMTAVFVPTILAMLIGYILTLVFCLLRFAMGLLLLRIWGVPSCWRGASIHGLLRASNDNGLTTVMASCWLGPFFALLYLATYFGDVQAIPSAGGAGSGAPPSRFIPPDPRFVADVLAAANESGLVETNQSWFWSHSREAVEAPMGGSNPTWVKWRPTIVAVESRDDYPKVAGVYTFGAPSTAKTPLTNDNRADGCFQGYRTFSSANGASDPVTWLCTAGGFKHAQMNAMALRAEEPELLPCSDATSEVPSGDTALDIALHFTSGYLQTVRAEILHLPQHLELYASLMRSVYVDRAGAKELAEGVNYRFVAEAEHGADLTRLFQSPDTLDCIISFRGSDNAGDWINNAGVGSREFCNFVGVHSGFVQKFTDTVTSQQFQLNLRANFPKCASVSATGHSLGGAVAEMFAACANRGPQGLTPLVDLSRGSGLTVAHQGWMTYMAYLGQITWNQGTPELMPPLL